MYLHNKSKYHNHKTTCDGIVFDSKLEARRWEQLKRMLAAGEIKNLQRQPNFILQPSFKKHNKTYRAIEYRADFQYQTQDGRTVVEDVKGIETDVFKIKRKMFEYKFPELSLVLVKKV